MPKALAEADSDSGPHRCCGDNNQANVDQNQTSVTVDSQQQTELGPGSVYLKTSPAAALQGQPASCSRIFIVVCCKMGNDEYERRRTTPISVCMAAFKWIPVIFITAVLGWSYYAYVYELCVIQTENRVAMAFMLFFYHLSLIMLLWSYWRTVYSEIGRVPSHWRIPDAEVDRLLTAENQEAQKRILNNFARNLPVTNRTISGSVRFCDKCKIIKPDRSHHCSVCHSCVLKMDHHCPWVNNCVNFYNYKYFVLFLGYALIYCLYVAGTTLHDFILFWKNQNEYSEQGSLGGSNVGRLHILFLFFIAIMFAISLVSLFGYHIYLTLMNRTTLETFRAPIFNVGGPDKNGYNLGHYANFCEVFGDNWRYWFLPVFTSRGNGLEYPTKIDQQNRPHHYDAMGATQTAGGEPNRLDGQPTDKLIADIPMKMLFNNHQPHQVRINNNQANEAHHQLLDPKRPSILPSQNQVIVEIETLPENLKTTAPVAGAGTSNVVVDIVGDQQGHAKEVGQQNGGAHLVLSK